MEASVNAVSQPKPRMSVEEFRIQVLANDAKGNWSDPGETTMADVDRGTVLTATA